MGATIGWLLATLVLTAAIHYAAIVLIGPKSPEPSVPDVPVVRAPSNTGVILLRFLVVDSDQLARVESARGQVSCALLGSAAE